MSRLMTERHAAWSPGVLVLVLLLLTTSSGVSAWEEMAGVCGRPSGYHSGTGTTNCPSAQKHTYQDIPMCTGGYAVAFSDVVWPTASAEGSVTVRLGKGGGFTEGLLFQAYDSATGKPIPNSPGFTQIPSRTQLYEGCPAPEQAISHKGELEGISSLTFTFKWSGADTLPAFLAFPTNEDNFYVTRPTCLLPDAAACQANGGSCASTINCPYPGPYPKESCPPGGPVTTHLHAVVIWGCVVVMGVLGALLRLPVAYSMRAWLTTRRPLRSLRCTRAGCWYQSSIGGRNSLLDSAAWFLREMTMDFFPVLWDITAAEFLSLLIFLVGQVAAMVLYGAAVKGQPSQEIISRALGAAAEVNFGVLLLPICRNSPLSMLAGTSFERTVKYHRILARYTIVLVLVHAIQSVIDYGVADIFDFTSTCYGFGNAYGLVAFWSFALLILFAHDFIRRRLYELFKHTHWLFFMVGMVTACLHSTKMVFYVAPGLLFYFGDWMLRCLSWGSRGALVVSAQEVTSEIVEMKMVLKGKIDSEPGSYVFVNIRAISHGAMDFHPFTISCLETDDKGSTTMTLHVKNMGPGQWSDKLQKKIAEKSELKAWVEGPYGKLAVDLGRYKTIIASSGGIGVTPMMPLLQMISDPEARRAHMGSVTKLVWIWTVRDTTAIAPFKDQISRAISAAQGLLDVRIYVSRANKGDLSAEDGNTGKEPLIRVDVAPPGSNMAAATAAADTNGTAELPQLAGRPHWGVLYQEVVSQNADANLPAKGVCSLVCGPAPLVLDVQNACADQGIHSHEETFAW